MRDIEIDAKSITESAVFEIWEADDYCHLTEPAHRIDVTNDKDFQAKSKGFWSYCNYDKERPPLLLNAIESTKGQSRFSLEGLLQVVFTKRVKKSTASKVLADFDKPHLGFSDLTPIEKNNYLLWGLGKRFDKACKAGR